MINSIVSRAIEIWPIFATFGTRYISLQAPPPVLAVHKETSRPYHRPVCAIACTCFIGGGDLACTRIYTYCAQRVTIFTTHFSRSSSEDVADFESNRSVKSRPAARVWLVHASSTRVHVLYHDRFVDDRDERESPARPFIPESGREVNEWTGLIDG